MIEVVVEAEDYAMFATQTENSLVSADPALPEFVRIVSPGQSGIVVQLDAYGEIPIAGLTVYLVTYLIRKD